MSIHKVILRLRRSDKNLLCTNYHIDCKDLSYCGSTCSCQCEKDIPSGYPFLVMDVDQSESANIDLAPPLYLYEDMRICQKCWRHCKSCNKLILYFESEQEDGFGLFLDEYTDEEYYEEYEEKKPQYLDSTLCLKCNGIKDKEIVIDKEAIMIGGESQIWYDPGDPSGYDIGPYYLKQALNNYHSSFDLDCNFLP